MDRGTYTAASGGLAQLRKLEVVNNNLANINTPGFKRQFLTGEVQTFEATLASMVTTQDPYARPDHERTPGVMNVESRTDFSPGAIRATGNPLDVALRHQNDFFQIITPNGLHYTRAGNFTLAESGDMVTPDGFQVQGDGGPITVGGGAVSITQDGSVMVDGNLVARLGIVRIEEPDKLERVGSNRFALQAGAPAPTDVAPEVIPQSLEMSNVTGVSSIIDLITAQRAFQAYTRVAESIDTLNQAAINQIGRPRG